MVCLAIPGLGPLLYWLAGINRIRTRAQYWQETGSGIPFISSRLCPWPQGASDARLAEDFSRYRPLLNLADAVTRRSLLPGNRISLLANGEEAYPAMLEAIEQATRTVYLCSYIFETNATGRQFVAALQAAAERGLDVRVLVDALGERYNWPPIHRLLRGTSVRVSRFLPFTLSGRGFYFNLRNHRKLLVIDDAIGFTGGMNIGDRHLAQRKDNPGRARDLHFKIEGPVATHLHEAFLEDWGFAEREEIPSHPTPALETSGGAYGRGISAGPNEDFEKLTWLIVGACNIAHDSIRIMTPYFIPDRTLITVLNSAALRGVQVDIVLPERSNLPFVDWASRAYFGELLQHGVIIHLQPAPFNHAKYLLIDDHYALVGSANLDPRSLRLNFEFNLEVYDQDFNRRLAEHFASILSTARPTTMDEIEARSLPIKLRDGASKLLSPYL